MKRFHTLAVVIGISCVGIAAEKVPGQQNELGDIESLRTAIVDLLDTFGEKYPGGQHYLEQLEKIQDPKNAEFKALQREALIANPLVSGQPVLYVSRKQYPGGHHNTETMFQSDEQNVDKYNSIAGGSMKSVDLKTGNVRTIVPAGKTECVRDPEVSFDGKKIVFSMRKSVQDDFHIYEVNADGSKLKQLTSMPAVFDIDPIYLPDGGIVFTSSREQKYCMCNIHIMANLFRMDADGANIHQIGKSTLFEGHSSIMPDGRIMYDRWEYVDRNFGDAQGLWTVNPDGTTHAIYWGNNTGSPGGVIDGKIIPGTQLCIATLGSCHDRPWGAIGIIDRQLGVDGKEPIIKTWPTSARELANANGSFDAFKQVNPRYEDPYPLGKNYFLASKTVAGERMAIVLLDMFGNEIVLHEEETMGCYDPMPVASRPKPAVLPVKRDYKNKNGIFYVQNVYIGTHMEGVEHSEVKHLRVVESPPKKNWTIPSWVGQGVHRPGMNWSSFENKRILGTVPVEEDGSAHFECPSDKHLFFQLLDKEGKMIQSMRSGTMIQSGETQGCVGCHEDRVKDTPPVTKHPMALKRKPSELKGWLNGDKIFSYQRDMQPVFDKNCVKCHDYGKPAGKKLNLAGDRTLCFNASYVDLWSSGNIKLVAAGPAAIQQAKSWGSHASPIVNIVTKGIPEGKPGYQEHQKVRLKSEDLERLITWLDINGPYYPTYDSAYPQGVTGRAPIDEKTFERLTTLTGAPFVLNRNGGHAQVSFERPEMSLCLENLDKNSEEHKEALDIIKAGTELLKKTPRADMEGFVPCAKDQERNAKFARLTETELQFRNAIDSGRKLYDPGIEAVD